VADEVAAGADAVGVDGFHQVIVVEVDFFFGGELGDWAEVDVVV
jgi:hypothetical protein